MIFFNFPAVSFYVSVVLREAGGCGGVGPAKLFTVAVI